MLNKQILGLERWRIDKENTVLAEDLSLGPAFILGIAQLHRVGLSGSSVAQFFTLFLV